MPKQPALKNGPDFRSINTSVMPLDYNRRQNLMGSVETMNDDDNYRPFSHTTHTKDSAEEMNKENYRPANYAKALEYKCERSYLKKQEGKFKELDLFGDTEQLKYFGLGPYFYVELFRRLSWLLLVMTVLQAITILINWRGDGLSNYEASFSTYLIKTTLGNFSGSSSTSLTNFDSLLQAAIPALNFLALLIFALIWRVHRRRAAGKQEEDNADVKPQKFCIEFEGFDAEESSEEELKKFFSAFGPVYEASLVRSHEDSLGLFEQLDEIDQQIKQEEHEAILDGGSKSSVQKLRRKKEEAEKRVYEVNVHPSTIAAYVHFQFQKTKRECLDQFRNHYRYAKCSHSFCRTFCCCCVPQPSQKITFKNKALLVRSEKVPAPEDINWDHFEITTCGRVLRGCFAFFVILVFLLVSCIIIGLCSIYITSQTKNCDGITVSSYTAATATAAGDTVLKCYCNANLVKSFTDSAIKTACEKYLTGIYVEQSIQYVVIFTASLMNFLFGLIVDRLINCVRPASQESALFAKTAIYTLFLVLNSVVVPVLIYADIFGFQASSYVSLLTIVSADASEIFKVSNISFYPNFTSLWYRNVSPIFTNFLIFNTLTVWVFLALDKCCFADKSHLENKEGKVLQKRMNREITEYRLDVYKEMANLYLVLLMVLLFFAGVPVLLPLGLINILSRYLSNRSLLQKNSVRVDGLGEEFSSLSSTILTIVLIVFPLLGEWMLIANPKIFSDFSLLFGSISSSYGVFYQLQMQLYLPFYIAISILAIVDYIIFSFVMKFCGCGCCQSPPPNLHTRPFWEYAKGMNILCSYNIRKNDKMRNAILYLQKYLGEKHKQ